MTTVMPTQYSWDQLLTSPPKAVFKQDRRSKVWRIDLPANAPGTHSTNPSGPSCQSWVIKRFDHSPLRQRLALCMHLHPAQLERDQSQKLIDAGLPVIPILAMHVQPAGLLGCRVHLATAYRGDSLQILKQQGRLSPKSDQTEAILNAIGAIAATMLESGWVFRDFKTANILIDAQFKPWLIDVGSARRGRPCASGSSGGRAWRMLRLLDHTMTQDGWSAEERRDTLARPLAILCPEPVDHAYDKLARIVLK